MKNKVINVGLIGRTNAGKSTLINSLVGEKISIENKKINTTLESIIGVLNICNTQIIFYDTPGSNLLNATKDATNTGLNLAGCDARISEISANIEEVINSYDIVLNNKRLKIKPVRSLCGHQIEKYKIHHKKAIPIIRMDNYHEKMKEGEFYAIETFASTGTGNVIERGNCSHYMVDYRNEKKKNFQNMNSDEKLLLTTLYKKRSTLPFCPRWLKSYGINNYSDE